MRIIYSYLYVIYGCYEWVKVLKNLDDCAAQWYEARTS